MAKEEKERLGNSKITDEQVMELYGTKPVNEIAKELGVSRVAVMNRAKKLGITRRERRKRVEEEIHRLQGEEIVRRAEEFRPQLAEFYRKLLADLNDYDCLKDYLKDKIEEEINDPSVDDDQINRSISQLQTLLMSWLKRVKPFLTILHAFCEADILKWQDVYNSSYFKGEES
jgi:predicted transcriptional regulator